MTDAEKQVVRDLRAYLDYALETNSPLIRVLGVLVHDARGLTNKVECFSPQSSGYEKFMQARQAVAP